MGKEILQDIYILKVPLPDNPLKNLNAYFIAGTHKNLLLDTGFNDQTCYTALVDGLQKLKADMGNTDIFLTHFHTDHSGLCGRLATENTRIYISEIDKEYLDGASVGTHLAQLRERYLTLGFPKAELDKSMKNSPIKKYLPPKGTEYTGIRDGWEIDLGRYRLQAIMTPGHTPGHMCLYEKEHRILFSGDHIIFDITPNISSWQWVENSLGLYLDSLKKTRKLAVETTLSAHRSPRGNHRNRIDELIQHHERRIAETQQIVKDFPGSTTYAIAAKMKWSIKAKNWNEFPITQKWFAVGEASSHLEYLLAEDLIKRRLEDGVFIYETF